MSTAKYDLFISHASEDKEGFVRPLATLLRELGLTIWYDEHSLTIGDSLSASIDAGLRDARFGLVILSQDFLKKPWPEYEYRSLLALGNGGAKRILPVWLNVGRDDIIRFSPHLADTVAVTATDDPLATALAALQVARPDVYQRLRRRATAETFTTHISKIVKSPIIGPPMTKSQLKRLRLIREALFEVFPQDWEDLVADARRDSLNGREDEISIWESIAGVYLQTCRAFSLSPDERAGLFHGLLNESLGMPAPDQISGSDWFRFALEEYGRDLQTEP